MRPRIYLTGDKTAAGWWIELKGKTLAEARPAKGVRPLQAAEQARQELLQRGFTGFAWLYTVGAQRRAKINVSRWIDPKALKWQSPPLEAAPPDPTAKRPTLDLNIDIQTDRPARVTTSRRRPTRTRKSSKSTADREAAKLICWGAIVGLPLLYGVFATAGVVVAPVAEKPALAASTVLGLALTPILVSMYLAPTILAIVRHHQNVLAILLFNVFLGWTGITWVVAMILAVTTGDGRHPDYGPRVLD